MKSGIRKGILSDESVLKACPDQNSVPLNKLHLAAITATGKIVRPQKAAYMFNNLPNMSQAEKQSLIEDYVLRSQKAKPLVIPERVYSTLSLDKGNALVRQVANQPGGDLGAILANDLQGTVAAVNRQNSDPTANEPPTTQEEDEEGRQLQHYIRRGQQYGHTALNVSGGPDPFFTQIRTNTAEPSSSTQPIFGINNPPPPPPPDFQSPLPPGGRVGTHIHFPTPPSTPIPSSQSPQTIRPTRYSSTIYRHSLPPSPLSAPPTTQQQSTFATSTQQHL